MVEESIKKVERREMRNIKWKYKVWGRRDTFVGGQDV
jgi:hypothetical protein